MKNVNTQLWSNAVMGSDILEPCYRMLSGLVDDREIIKDIIVH